MENNHVQWENPRNKWSFSIAMFKNKRPFWAKSKRPRLHAEGVHARVHHLILKDHRTVESLVARGPWPPRTPQCGSFQTLDTGVCYMYVFMNLCVYVCGYIYIHINSCVHRCVCIYICICAYMSKCVCMHT